MSTRWYKKNQWLIHPLQWFHETVSTSNLQYENIWYGKESILDQEIHAEYKVIYPNAFNMFNCAFTVETTFNYLQIFRKVFVWNLL